MSNPIQFQQYLDEAEVRWRINRRNTLERIKYQFEDLEIEWVAETEEAAIQLAGNTGRLSRYLKALAEQQLIARRSQSSQWGEFT